MLGAVVARYGLGDIAIVGVHTGERVAGTGAFDLGRFAGRWRVARRYSTRRRPRQRRGLVRLVGARVGIGGGVDAVVRVGRQLTIGGFAHAVGATQYRTRARRVIITGATTPERG